MVLWSAGAMHQHAATALVATLHDLSRLAVQVCLKLFLFDYREYRYAFYLLYYVAGKPVGFGAASCCTATCSCHLHGSFA